MIDIHSHILPGVDDGAKTEADSIAMAKLAIEEGIHTIVATPHHKNGVFTNVRSNIMTYTNILNELFRREGLDLELIPGQETRINGDFVEDLINGDILPLNDGEYVFVELPSDHVPRYTQQVLFDIQVAGFKPIIVHPERNQEIIEHPNQLYEFVKRGALTQVTAGSVIGKFGKTVQKISEQLIDANLTHFIASDAHNTTSRKFWMREALSHIRNEFGTDLEYIFLENSQLLLDGFNVNRIEPSKIKKKKFFGLF